MADLPRPVDVLDLLDGEELITRVTGMAEGTVSITVRRGREAGASKVVNAIRLYVPESDKPTVPNYWDLTSTSLAPDLRARIPAAIAGALYIKLHKYGEQPYARFSFAVMPPEFKGPAHIGAHR